MSDLESALRTALQLTTFQTVEIEMIDDITTYTYTPQRSSILTADELRKTMTTAAWDSADRQQIPFIRTKTPDCLLVDISSQLRDLFGDFIDPDTDRFGHSFPAFGHSTRSATIRSNGATELQHESKVEDFASGLIKSAAIIGASRVAELIYGWVDGEPFHYRTCDVLYGISTDYILKSPKGLRLIPLPLSSDSLPHSFPKSSYREIGDCLGRSMLQLDCSIGPALFRIPEQTGSVIEFDFSSPLNAQSLDTFYKSLSLVSGSYVNFIIGWNEYDAQNCLVGIANHGGARYGSARRFGRVGQGFSKSLETGLVSVNSPREPGTDLSLKQLEEAQRLVTSLETLRQANHRIWTAISRWIRALQPQAELTDQYIDMRIALEALYLDSSEGELGFRLATTGAWHLGRSWSEREELQQDLKKFYGTASRIVHAAQVPQGGSSQIEYLSSARDICQRGLLKVIKQEPIATWNQLLLGREAE